MLSLPSLVPSWCSFVCVYQDVLPFALYVAPGRYLIDGVEREMELTLLLDRQGGPPACNVYRLPYQPPPPPGSKGPPPPVMPPPVTRALAAEAAQVCAWCERT